MKQVQIMNSFGQPIESISLSTTHNHLSLNHIPKGEYIIILDQEKGADASKKLIIRR